MTTLFNSVKEMFAPKEQPKPIPIHMSARKSAQIREWIEYLEAPGELYRLLESCRETVRKEGGLLSLRYGSVVNMVRVMEPAALLMGMWNDPQDFFRSRMEPFVGAMERAVLQEPYSLSSPLVQSMNQWSKFNEEERRLTIQAFDTVAKHPKIRELFVFQREFANRSVGGPQGRY